MAGPAKVIIITKKAKGHGGHHGGAWKVAYADFVTAMMALFILLWILSQTDKDVKQKISEYFRTGVFSGAPSALQGGSGLLDKGYLDPTGADSKDLELETLEVTARKVEKFLRTQASGNEELAKLMKDVHVQVTDEGLLIQIVDTKGSMLFDVNSSDLKPPLVELLKLLGPMLHRIGNRVQIHGHTDGRKFPPGSPKTNWGLSFERADAARGVLEPLLNPGQLMGVYAHGDSQPTEADPLAPANRRLAILAVNKDQPASKPTTVTVSNEAKSSDDHVAGAGAPRPSSEAKPTPSSEAKPTPSSEAKPTPSSGARPAPH
ncbi:MAG: OmpA family protein [Myxococcota bacterium]|jgi:chemotaxis protein MotB|nr:OmpA family protein [Myxococcota bacterium]